MLKSSKLYLNYIQKQQIVPLCVTVFCTWWIGFANNRTYESVQFSFCTAEYLCQQQNLWTCSLFVKSIAISLRARWPGFDSWLCRFLLFSITSRRVLGSSQPLPIGYRCSFPRIKRSVREAKHTLVYSAKVKNAWSYTSIPPSVANRDLEVRSCGNAVLLNSWNNRTTVQVHLLLSSSWCYYCFIHIVTFLLCFSHFSGVTMRW
jgi:hypothetical protein